MAAPAAGHSANISAMLQVTFAEVVRVLEGLGSTVPAAEAHGCLVGALCTSQHYPLERWLEEIIPDGVDPDGEGRADDASQHALRLLYSDTLNALRGEDMEFEVLLPEDDISLEARASGLSQWCQGFLYGFGTGQSHAQTHAQAPAQAEGESHGNPGKRDELPANVHEILNDLTHIGRASVELDGDADNESEEEAYAEVVEYVRVGVQLIHDELIPAQAHRIDVGIDVGIDTGDAAGGPRIDTDDSHDAGPTTVH